MDNAPGRPAAPNALSVEVAAWVRHRPLIQALLRVPGREFTIRELSIESRTPYATAWRLVVSMVQAGLLRIRAVGASRLISVNRASPLLPAMERIASLDLHPHREAALRFARRASRIPEVQKVILFGSAHTGTAGLASDVDVALVLGSRKRGVMDRVYALAGAVQDETGLRLVPIPLSFEELQGASRLARDLREGEVLYDRA